MSETSREDLPQDEAPKSPEAKLKLRDRARFYCPGGPGPHGTPAQRQVEGLVHAASEKHLRLLPEMAKLLDAPRQPVAVPDPLLVQVRGLEQVLKKRIDHGEPSVIDLSLLSCYGQVVTPEVADVLHGYQAYALERDAVLLFVIPDASDRMTCYQSGFYGIYGDVVASTDIAYQRLDHLDGREQDAEAADQED